MAIWSSTDAATGSKSSMLGDTPCGAVWRKVDLHLHSPAVGSFRCPNGADLQTEAGRQKIIEAYVSQMHAAKIDIGAITDYNGIHSEWFIPNCDQAGKYGITVFPGAEISFSE
jgi:predicted metal-dependent phosphoesterase TrpH